jgi:hypothetical protein
MCHSPRALAFFVFVLVLVAPQAGANEPVVVIVDMDASTPGFQSEIIVGTDQPVIENIAIHIYDRVGERRVWSIGYLGGIDRGIAFGNDPNNQNVGRVERLVATGGVPVNPANGAVIWTEPNLDQGFAGPEVQYVEGGAGAPSLIGPPPGAPVFTVDVVLEDADGGDIFDFYLLDFVTVWSGGVAGAFSTTGPLTLDTGGDAVPDLTRTLYGIDPDAAIPVPPAAYLVDYVDGGLIPGPARILVVPIVSIDSADGGAPVASLLLRPGFPNPFQRSTTVRYQLSTRSPVTLGVYDMTGRLLRLVEHSPVRDAGEHEARWDGRDESGRLVSPGVYFWRLEAGSHRESQPIVRAHCGRSALAAR